MAGLEQPSGTLDERALTEAHLAVENVLIDMRDSRIGVLGRANGFVVNEPDGTPSSIMRLGTREGLRIAIERYLEVVGPNWRDDPQAVAEHEAIVRRESELAFMRPDERARQLVAEFGSRAPEWAKARAGSRG